MLTPNRVRHYDHYLGQYIPSGPHLQMSAVPSSYAWTIASTRPLPHRPEPARWRPLQLRDMYQLHPVPHLGNVERFTEDGLIAHLITTCLVDSC